MQVDFNKLIAYGLTLPQLLQAVSNSNINVGGNTSTWIESAVVARVGLIRSIRRSCQHHGVAEWWQSRSGQGCPLRNRWRKAAASASPAFDQDDDIVQGIVLMRRGEQSSPTIARVEALVASINNSSILPPGVRSSDLRRRI